MAHPANCPVCGLVDALCGPPSPTQPADAGLYAPPIAGLAAAEQGVADLKLLQEQARLARREVTRMDRVQVDRGDGVVFNFSPDDAKKYCEANPGAKRLRSGRRAAAEVEAQRAAEDEAKLQGADAKAVREGDVEDKAVGGPPQFRARGK